MPKDDKDKEVKLMVKEVSIISVQKEMDIAAEMAAKELLDKVPSDAAAQVADWWRRWYLTAGHKRLARILMGVK